MHILTRRSLIAAGAGIAVARLPLSAAPKIPRPAPELAVRLNSGEQVLLSRFKGKIVILEMLLTTCPHCQRCAQVMQKVLDEYSTKGVVALGAAVNDDARNDLLRFQATSGAKFPIGTTSHESSEPFIYAEKPPAYFPQLLLIDRKGQIRAHFPGTDDFFRDEETNLKKQLDRLLSESAAVSSTRKAVSTK